METTETPDKKHELVLVNNISSKNTGWRNTILHTRRWAKVYKGRSTEIAAAIQKSREESGRRKCQLRAAYPVRPVISTGTFSFSPPKKKIKKKISLYADNWEGTMSESKRMANAFDTHSL